MYHLITIKNPIIVIIIIIIFIRKESSNSLEKKEVNLKHVSVIQHPHYHHQPNDQPLTIFCENQIQQLTRVNVTVFFSQIKHKNKRKAILRKNNIKYIYMFFSFLLFDRNFKRNPDGVSLIIGK